MTDAIEECLLEIDDLSRLIEHDIQMFEDIILRELKEPDEEHDYSELEKTLAAEIVKRDWIKSELATVELGVLDLSEATGEERENVLKRLHSFDCMEVMRISLSSFPKLISVVWPPSNDRTRLKWLEIEKRKHSKPGELYTSWNRSEAEDVIVSMEDCVFDRLADLVREKLERDGR